MMWRERFGVYANIGGLCLILAMTYLWFVVQPEVDLGLFFLTCLVLYLVVLANAAVMATLAWTFAKWTRRPR